jgi:hypothetical protein
MGIWFKTEKLKENPTVTEEVHKSPPTTPSTPVSHETTSKLLHYSVQKHTLSAENSNK